MRTDTAADTAAAFARNSLLQLGIVTQLVDLRRCLCLFHQGVKLIVYISLRRELERSFGFLKYAKLNVDWSIAFRPEKIS
jgi:hypothetical protein